jgi:hypothetical protein
MADFAACTVTPVIENSNRVEQFRAEIAAMHLKDPATGRETALLRLGVVLMVGGVVLAVVSYFASHSTKLALDQGDDTILALVGVGLTISGSALFLRYSLANFFRFWLARLIFEQRAATDRLAGRAEE